MLTKGQIQFINSLRLNKYRRINRKFLAEGPKLVQELLSSRFVCDSIYALPEWIKKNDSLLNKNYDLIEINEKELLKISALKTPNQVLAVVNMPKHIIDNDHMAVEGIVLVLDNIRDPGNMGTIIRTADWFGIQSIVCSENCVDVFNPKVVQATMGSIFRVKLFYTAIGVYLQYIHNKVPVFGTMLDGENLYEVDLKQDCVLIIGNESTGISDNLLPFISKKIRIPNFSPDQAYSAESLNASVAAAIVIAEYRRKFQSGN